MIVIMVEIDVDVYVALQHVTAVHAHAAGTRIQLAGGGIVFAKSKSVQQVMNLLAKAANA